MHLPPFLLDHWLAAYEFSSPPIRYNLASSTGPSWTFGELMSLGGSASRGALEGVQLTYAPPQGTQRLRGQIAEFHGVDPDWVLVTTGASEALAALYCLAAEPGASIVLPFPSFPAMPAMARAWGLSVSTYTLRRDDGFAQTAEHVLAAVDNSTRLVLVNTPHNPTGSVMSQATIERLASSLQQRGIPLIVDEVYHPLYFSGQPVLSAANVPNTIIVGDLSKALSLPGLRIGWLIDRDARRRERLLDVRSYFTISGSPLTEAIAAHALAHSEQILSRLRTVTAANLTHLKDFMSRHEATIGWIAPAGGTTAFPWRRDGRNARALCEALAREGVLLAPGDCFDAPEHFGSASARRPKDFSRRSRSRPAGSRHSRSPAASRLLEHRRRKPLAVDHVDATRDDDGCADEHAQVRRRRPQHPVEQHAPGERRIFQRRDHRRRRTAERFGEEILSDRATDAEPDDQRPVVPLHRHPAPGHGHTADDGHQQQRPHQRRGTRVGPRQDANRDRAQRIARRRRQRGQAANRHHSQAGWFQYDDDARKADEYCNPALPANALAEHQDGHCGDQERRRHEDGVCVRQRQLADGVHETPEHGDAEEAAQYVQQPIVRRQVAPAAEGRVAGE
jgi:aspartate/methionine/tyrosine aminotransferase